MTLLHEKCRPARRWQPGRFWRRDYCPRHLPRGGMRHMRSWPLSRMPGGMVRQDKRPSRIISQHRNTVTNTTTLHETEGKRPACGKSDLYRRRYRFYRGMALSITGNPFVIPICSTGIVLMAAGFVLMKRHEYAVLLPGL
jgi:hypothetical protein